MNAPSSGDILYQCIVFEKRRHKKKKRKLTVVVYIHSIFCQKKAVNVLYYLHCIHKKISFFITQSMFCHHYYYHFLFIIFLNHATSASSAIVNIRWIFLPKKSDKLFIIQYVEYRKRRLRQPAPKNSSF